MDIAGEELGLQAATQSPYRDPLEKPWTQLKKKETLILQTPKNQISCVRMYISVNYAAISVASCCLRLLSCSYLKCFPFSFSYLLFVISASIKFLSPSSFFLFLPLYPAFNSFILVWKGSLHEVLNFKFLVSSTPFSLVSLLFSSLLLYSFVLQRSITSTSLSQMPKRRKRKQYPPNKLKDWQMWQYML